MWLARLKGKKAERKKKKKRKKEKRNKGKAQPKIRGNQTKRPRN